MASDSTLSRPQVFSTILIASILLLTSCNNGSEVTESDRIRVFEPKMGAEIRSPFVLRGEARVFEGTVRYRIIDEQNEILVDSFTTAIADEIGQFGAFQEQVEFEDTHAQNGKIEVFEESAEDGREVGMVIIPVKFR